MALKQSPARAAYYLCPNTLLQLCGYPFQHYNSWRYNVWQSEDIVICSLRADNLRSLDIIEHRNSGSDIRGRWSQFQANVFNLLFLHHMYPHKPRIEKQNTCYISNYNRNIGMTIKRVIISNFSTNIVNIRQINSHKMDILEAFHNILRISINCS